MFEPDPLHFPKPKQLNRSWADRRPSQATVTTNESPKAAMQRKVAAIRKFTRAWTRIRKQIFINALRRNARLNRPSIQAKKITPKAAIVKPSNTPLMPAPKVMVNKPAVTKPKPNNK